MESYFLIKIKGKKIEYTGEALVLTGEDIAICEKTLNNIKTPKGDDLGYHLEVAKILGELLKSADNIL